MLWKYEIKLLLQGDIILYVLGPILFIYPIYFLIYKVKPKYFEYKLQEQDNIQALDEEEKISDDDKEKQFRDSQYNKDEVSHGRHFLSIIDQYEQHIQESFLYQSFHAIVCAFVMAILIYLVLEEKFTQFYITIAYILGVILCLCSHYYTMLVAKYGVGQFLLLARLFQRIHNILKRKNTIGTISFGYESGIAVISFFLGLSIWLLAMFQKIYLVIYGEKIENYQKIFMFLYGGAAFGYATISFFYKIGGSLYSSGSQIASQIFQNSENMNEHSLNNPAVFVNRMGEYFSEFQGTFTDISGLTMFSLLVLQIMIADSEELLKFDVALYFSMFFLIVCFLCSFIAWIIGYFVYENNQQEEDDDDEQKTTASYVRFQILLTQALALIVFGLFAFFLLPESFQLGYSKNAQQFKYDDKKTPKKQFFLKPSEPSSSQLPAFLQVQASAPKVKNWEAFICLISGCLNSLCLFSTFEYFTSHYYKPVRSMLAICEDDPSLAVLSSDVIGTLPQIIILFPLIMSMVICQYIAGFFGLALFTLAFLSLIYTLQGVSTLAAFSQITYKIGLLSELYGVEKFRIFGIRFAAVNYQVHTKQSQVIGVTVVAFASIGAYNHYMNIENGLKGNVVGLSGLFVGVIFISLLRGSMLALTQYLSIQLIYWYRLTMKTIKESYSKDLKPDHSATIEDLSKSINLSILMLFIFCIILVILLGLFFGTNFILGLLLGLILTSAYFVIYSLIAGSSIINAKFFLEDKVNSEIPKTDQRSEALRIASTHAYSYKDTAGSSLLQFIFFIVTLCLLAAPLFDKTGWISKLIEK